ncbi:hypothetical protein Tco_0475087 [Tanacetum coccineum]
MNDGLQAFMDRFKSESLHIKGVPSVLHISEFFHGHRHPKLAKKLNDKIPRIVDEMFERVRAFIRGEAAAGSAEVASAPEWDKGVTRSGWSGGQERTRRRSGLREFRRNMGTCAPYSRRNMFTPLTKTPMEILAMEMENFPPPPPLIWTSEKQNLNKFCDYHRDRGHNTNEYAPIILEGTIEGYHVRRFYVDGGSSSVIMCEHCFKSFSADVKSRLRKANAPLVEFSGKTYHSLGL